MAKKTQLTYREIEDRLRCLKDSNFTKNEITKDEIGYRILFGFGKSERELDRYCEGKGVIHTFDGLLIKGLFCYRSSSTLRFADDLDDLKRDYQVLKAAPRIIAYTLLMKQIVNAIYADMMSYASMLVIMRTVTPLLLRSRIPHIMMAL